MSLVASTEPRSIKSSSVPHPVFGRGSMAIPDLTSRRKVASPTQQDHNVYSPMPATSTQIHPPLAKHELNTEPAPVMSSDRRSGVEAPRQPRATAPSAALKRYIHRVEQVSSAQPSNAPFERDVPRPRTVSTPSGTHPTRSTTHPSSRPPSPRARIPPRSPNFDANGPPPAFDSNSPISKSPSRPFPKSSTPVLITPTIPKSSSPAFGVKHSTFSTSTPEVSNPKATPLTPQHRTPSLHPPKGKDPTPSISRLKGRGFVQSMVKASSALEAAAAGSTMPEVGKSSPSKRSPPVASRWKPESSQLPSSRPATTPIPANFRKSWTPAAATPSVQRTADQRKSWATSEPLKFEQSEREGPTRSSDRRSASRSVRVNESHDTGRSVHAVGHQHTGQSPRVPEAENSERSIHKAPSLPSLSVPSLPSTPPPASPGGHGLGSSSTMFSYIKPMKTGDDHATGHPHTHSRPTTPNLHLSAGGLTPTQDADELGHLTGVGLSGQRQRDGVTGFPAPSGRPLVHVRP